MSERILVVDDDDRLAAIVRDGLSRMGYRVALVADSPATRKRLTMLLAFWVVSARISRPPSSTCAVSRAEGHTMPATQQCPGAAAASLALQAHQSCVWAPVASHL